MPELIRHPNSPAGAIRSVSAQATRTREGRLALSYQLHGELDSVIVPPPSRARIGWKLWRHTCCEAFIAAKGAQAYHEFNFSPSGEWAAYGFGRYREGASLDDAALDPQIAVERRTGRLELYALVDLARLAPAHRQGPLRLGLAVIVEEESGAYSYWALRHAPGKPDFHHADAFALELA